MKKLALIFTLVTIIISLNSIMAQDNLTLKPYTFISNSGDSVEAELGTFDVLENRSKKNNKTISLSFVRFKSTNPNPGAPIIYLAGGPGGSGIGTAKGRRFPLFMALRKVADVIAFDQRGTGLSNHIPKAPKSKPLPLDKPGSIDYYVKEMNALAKKSIDFWKKEGIDVNAYNTTENASDLEDLRKALGAEKISLWGISYGSHLAFSFIKQYESSVDKTVLASLEGPDHTIKLPSYNQKFLQYLNEKIKEDDKAAAKFPDLLLMMKTVFERLEEKPVVTEYFEKRMNTNLKVAISKFDLQLVTSFFLLKNPENSIKAPYLFKQMYDGDFSQVAPMVAMLKFYTSSQRLMPLAMDAMSGISEKRWKKVQKEADKAILGRSTNFPFPDIAFGLGLPDLGDDFRTNPKSKIPALFFSGTMDGRTYIPSAKKLVKGFKNGSHIIIDGAGHDLFMSTPKVEDYIIKFLKGEKINSQTIKIDIPDFVIGK